MKQTILYFIAGLFLLIGCAKEELSITESSQVGYLTVEDLTLQQAEQISVSSRAVDADLYVEITDAKEATTTYNPGAVPAKIELAVGNCTIKAYNAAYKDKTLNAAKYYAEKTVEIEEGKVEYLSLEVPMVNFGVSLSLPENFWDWFSAYKFTVGAGDASQTMLDEGKVAYFDYEKDVVINYTLSVTSEEELDGTFTQTGSYGSDEGKAIETGKIYRITYNWETKALEIN